MKPLNFIVSGFIRFVTRILCRIEHTQLERIPMQGPLIVVCNHIGSIEVPLIYAHLQPRKLAGVAKIETWDNRLLGWLFDLWEAIPIRRGELDLEAVRRSLDAIEAGSIYVISPEGTRSGDGKLQCARPGVVILAMHSKVPILPVAHWGVEEFSQNLKRLKRTDFHFRVGEPFYLNTDGIKVTHTVRQEMVDEIMGQIAALMPPAYHGNYADAGKTTPKYLRFL